jgi:signal transduction histidine kinase
LQSNALKFTEKGSIKIQASIEEEEESKYLKVAVIDTGVGISE